MTYLSRIRINPLRAESRKLLSNPRALHGAVQGGLPGPQDAERVLWRMDADDPHRPHLFVLTRSRPDWTRLVEQAGWPDAGGEHAAIRDYTPLLGQIAVGREFAFRLTASPVQNTPAPQKPTPAQAAHIAADTDGKRRGFRLGHRTAAAQLDWFLTRTGRWGFDVPASRTDPAAPGLVPSPPDSDHVGQSGRALRDPNPRREVRITSRNRHSFKKNGNGPHVVFHTATFEGRLRITDPSAFTARLLDGIGPSKAYGCGLLTLAPLAGRKD
ncbi:type I-E CRISPR-associated protein Cas6/Cse3/CasE [Streptomyces pinistramenti]|uniref:type I-E CRISPR-associated protein Cas6/Cse3/CasE n=1 Tax=Streptomyces pinistramenti TaxID=2884812 RepID=UPI001D07611E|nr:type I-E CRISPR-associated protein Cas6/Cse3/CasE [Streptomyces pinistramenti]MCB5911519.1 type I-E CRISPR-associated protein Cas6/Cse3/CasE [Streptomyces pinistramenti]